MDLFVKARCREGRGTRFTSKRMKMASTSAINSMAMADLCVWAAFWGPAKGRTSPHMHDSTGKSD